MEKHLRSFGIEFRPFVIQKCVYRRGEELPPNDGGFKFLFDSAHVLYGYGIAQIVLCSNPRKVHPSLHTNSLNLSIPIL